MRTLIIDDDHDQRHLLTALLTQADVGPVYDAADAEEALARAEENQPQLIVLDLSMPGHTGLDVLPDLLALSPGAAIVVLSNLPRRRLEETALRRGAVAYVEKRVGAEQLVREILRAAAMANGSQELVALALPAESTAPRAARAFVRDMLRTDEAAFVSSVELLVSEVVTNAVVHTASAPRIEVVASDASVRVTVHDDDPRLPRMRVPDLERPGGRGLHLLEEVASRWGAEPDARGKVVWFEIDRSA